MLQPKIFGFRGSVVLVWILILVISVGKWGFVRLLLNTNVWILLDDFECEQVIGNGVEKGLPPQFSGDGTFFLLQFGNHFLISVVGRHESENIVDSSWLVMHSISKQSWFLAEIELHRIEL